MQFDECELPEALNNNIAACGWEQPTPIQQLVIPKACEGFDILGGAPTGTGKSAAFLIPLIYRLSQKSKAGVRALILEPSRELALQVVEVCNKLCKDFDLSCGAIIGGADRIEQREMQDNIIVATPGRMLEFLRKEWLETNNIEFYVIDEADRMLDMGFFDDVNKITKSINKKCQTLLFSATLEGVGIRDFAKAVLHDPIEIRLGAGDDSLDKLPQELSSRAYYAASDVAKLKIISELLRTVRGKSIIFVKTRERLLRLDVALRRQGFKCATLQGDMSMSERQAAMRRFKEGETDMLIATDVAARGLDIADITHVYNFDLPANAAIYVHRAGRTARAGANGIVISLVLASEIATLEKIERYTGREVERRAIKNLCAEFPVNPGVKHQSEKKRSRAAVGGGFDKRRKDEEKRHKPKERLRDRKNKGKPDFAAKRARKAALAAKKAEASAK